MILTPLQIFEVARRAGFTLLVAIIMTAIALRESSGKPAAFNGEVGTGDCSYGLWQINLRDKNVAALMVKLGIKAEALFDPATNARAAFAMYGGVRSNLNLGWYIDRVNKDGSPSDYKARYAAHLPAAIEAAMASPLGQVLKEV